jgi:hypothetical protein
MIPWAIAHGGVVGPGRPNRAQPCPAGPCLAGPSLAGLVLPRRVRSGPAVPRLAGLAESSLVLTCHATRAEGHMANFPLPCRAECVRAPPVSFSDVFSLSYYAPSSPLCYFSFTFLGTPNRSRQSAGRCPQKRRRLVAPSQVSSLNAGHVLPRQAMSSPDNPSGPCLTAPSPVEPRHAGQTWPGQTGPGRAEPSRPSLTQPFPDNPSLAKRAMSPRAEPSRTMPDQATRAEPSLAQPCRALPCLASQTGPCPAEPCPASPRTVRRKGLDQTVAHPGPDRGKKKERTKSPMT